MNQILVRRCFVGLLRRYQRLRENTSPAADSIRLAVRAAWITFERRQPELQSVDPQALEIIRRLFMQHLVLLNVASKLDTKKAAALAAVTQKIMQPLLEDFSQKPGLRVVN